MSQSPEIKREKARAYAAKRYRRRMFWLQRYKMAQGCAECGFDAHPAALDFDHIDPTTKLFIIPRNIRRNLKTLIAEVRKCRIVCANCHRIHSRKQWDEGVTYKPNPRKN